MSYAVIWSPAAISALASVWVSANDRQAVTLAEARIDAKLAGNPQGEGKLVSEGLWRIDVPPLKAYFEIEDAHQVRVLGVGRLP